MLSELFLDFSFIILSILRNLSKLQFMISNFWIRILEYCMQFAAQLNFSTLYGIRNLNLISDQHKNINTVQSMGGDFS